MEALARARGLGQALLELLSAPGAGGASAAAVGGLPGEGGAAAAARLAARGAALRAAAALRLPQLYAAHPQLVLGILGLLGGGALLLGLVCVRGALRCGCGALARATGLRALRALAEDGAGGGEDDALPENPFWAGTHARRRAVEAAAAAAAAGARGGGTGGKGAKGE
jgi:hypothetical protein